MHDRLQPLVVHVPERKRALERAFARYRAIVDDWPAFIDALARPLPTVVWVNTLRASIEDVRAHLAAAGMAGEPLAWYPRALRLPAAARPGRTWLYQVGLVHVQEEVSLLPVLLLDPQPGERVLDIAAAPGGKTVQAAVHMANRGTIVANDVGYGRMRALRHVLERMSILNVSTTIHDGTNLPRAMGGFDRVLVDVPCSCEGTARKNPEVVNLCGLEYALEHQGRQKALLRKAVLLCKPGGRIVYSTCTFAPEENEAVVDAIVRDFGEDRLRLLPARVPGFRSSPGLTAWQGRQFVAGMERAMRVWPHQNDTGGFFVAVLEKSVEGWHSRPPEVPPLPELWPARVVAPDPWVMALDERFGIPADTFAGYLFLSMSGKGLHLVSADHRPPPRPRPDAVGMLFLHTKGRTPKMTTAGALAFGRAATRNVVPLEEHQLEAYLTRQSIPLNARQVEWCTGPGFVIVTYAGLPVGTGLYRHRPPHQPVLESLFPKGWMRGPAHIQGST